MQRFPCLVQASLQSKRLPGKVLAEIEPGLSLLQLTLRRVLQAQSVEGVVVSIPIEPADDHLEAQVQEWRQHMPLLQVIRLVPKEYPYSLAPLWVAMGKPEWFFRVTADCPFVDPALLDALAAEVPGLSASWCRAICTRSDLLPEEMNHYPPGFDLELLRLHPTEVAVALHGLRDCYAYPREVRVVPNLFPCEPGLRVCVDWWQDLQLVRFVYAELHGDVSYESISRWWNALHPCGPSVECPGPLVFTAAQKSDEPRSYGRWPVRDME